MHKLFTKVVSKWNNDTNEEFQEKKLHVYHATKNVKTSSILILW